MVYILPWIIFAMCSVRVRHCGQCVSVIIQCKGREGKGTHCLEWCSELFILWELGMWLMFGRMGLEW